jgi:ABC-2 type transport system ATP-binding protein
VTSTAANALVVSGKHLRKTFAREREAAAVALDELSIEVRRGTLTALVGPDGAGKTTLIRLIAALMRADAGELTVLDMDAATQPQQIQDRIGYMPQRFGLYEDLTVQENLDLYADLHGIPLQERQQRYPQLMSMTALEPFKKRLAGKLSGGMKQKLGLACTLVRSPELLLLDEPTVGVDPLSRRELWEIIHHLVDEQQLTVLMSTAYLDEAERCHEVLVLHQGKVLAHGPPQQVADHAQGRTFVIEPPAQQSARVFQAKLLSDPQVVDAVPDGGRVRVVYQASAIEKQRSGAAATAVFDVTQATPTTARFEDGFMVLLRRIETEQQAGSIALARPVQANGSGAVVQVRDLVRQFGEFTAVDHVSFEVKRGEIFGLLGPNGAGKTTTFRMLCGLLPASSGTLQVAGADLRRARAEARQRIGYVAQKFSLYGALTVAENLEFFASAYGLRGAQKKARIDWALQQFELQPQVNAASGQLPGGYKQRLAMSAALLHEPEILFLDEPTSGADPLARRAFWRRITALAEQGVTVIVTTHFMQEAEYCDHVAILDAGRILAQGTPGELRRNAPSQAGQEASMEDAFIAVVEQARAKQPANAAA